MLKIIKLIKRLTFKKLKIGDNEVIEFSVGDDNSLLN